MHQGKLVFSQVMQHLPLSTFRRCVAKYDGERRRGSFTCLDQFYCMAFAQLAYRESLRDVEACLRAQGTKLYHMGIGSKVSRSTLADANRDVDWRIHAEVAQHLIAVARSLYADEPFGVELGDTVYALDSSTIDLCLSVFPWAPYRDTDAAIKLHTLLDIRGSIPALIHISDGKMHDVRILDQLIPEPGAIYIMDRGYLDAGRLFRLHQAGSFFVIRARSNTQLRRRHSRQVDRTSGLICDQVVLFAGQDTAHRFPTPVRRIRFRDPTTKKTLVFLTNSMALQAITVADLYRCRWQVELFFKWIKQHLRIKAFFGTSENAVKSQIWIAVSTYVLVAILRKRLRLETSLYQLLQILSLTLFEKTPLNQLFLDASGRDFDADPSKQLILFD
jgi:hypothetical protein